MHFVEKPGTSVEAMHRITVQASKDLRAIPGVRNFGSHIGRAEVADEVVGPNFTELWISIDPDADYQATVEEDRGRRRRLSRPVPRRADVSARADQGGADRRQRDASSCACTAPTWTCCARRPRRSRRRWPTVPGRDQPEGRAAGAGAADRGAAAARGGRALRPDAGPRPPGVDDAAQGARRSARSTRGRRSSTWSSGACRRCATDLAALRALADRHARPARRCAWATWPTWPIVPTPNEIKRENASRRLDITCNVQGRDLGSVAREIEAKVQAAPVRPRVPPGVPGRVRRPAGIDAAGSTRWRRWPWSASCCCCTSIFRRGGRRCSSRCTIPFALIGGVVGGAADRRRRCRSARWSASSPCSASPPATASCWSATSATWRLEEGEPFGVGLVLRGAEERLAPILMTALATGLALRAAGDRRQQAGPRDRVPAGRRHPRRAGHLDAAEPVPAAAAVRILRAACPGGLE